MIEVIHSTEGRIRYKSKAIKSDSRKANVLKAKLWQLPGVEDVIINRTSGCIVVHYSSDLISAGEISTFLENELHTPCLARRITPVNLPEPHTAGRANFNSSTLSAQFAASAGRVIMGVLFEEGVRFSMKRLFGVG